MKQYSPRAFTVAAAVSLVLCLAAWVRSYLPEYSTVRVYQGSLVLIFFGRDQARFIDPADNPSLDPGFPGTSARPPPRLDTEQVLLDARQWGTGKAYSVKTTKWREGGFEFMATNTRLAWGYFVVAVPFSAISLPLAIATAVGLLRWRRQRKRPGAGCCKVCGYDLRATADRCPECGTAPTGKAV